MSCKTKKLTLVIAILFTSALAVPRQVSADEDRTIPYPEGYEIKKSGASAYMRKGDNSVSPYYKHPDFYNLESNAALTMLRKFKTYQQTTEWSCGPCAALMVLYHYNVKSWDELGIAKAAGHSLQQGTATADMVRFFEKLGWKVTSSLSEGRLPEGRTFSDIKEFKPWVIRNLKNNAPIMVEFIDWGGHWLDIIGYDTMGTDEIGDDVIIFADPYDASDHLQDGYCIYPAERFYHMWFDAFILPVEHSKQQWIIAAPK